MIIENGYIQFYFEPSEISYDYGLPIPEQGSWGEIVPCQWRVMSKNLQSKSVVSGNAVMTSSYEILLSDQYNYTEKARIYNQDRVVIGEYAVIQDEHLHLLNMYRLYL